MKDIKLLSKNKYLKVPLLFTGGGGSILPKGLAQCNAIVTDGDCFIDADIDFNLNNYEIELKFEYHVDTSVSQSFFGWRHGANQRQLCSLVLVGGNLRTLYANQTYDKNLSNKNTLIYSMKNNSIQIKDFDNNVLYSISSNLSSDWIEKFYLFCFFSQNTPANKMLNGGKIIMFHAKNGSGIERNFIPAYCDEDLVITDNKGNICSIGTAGFYDTISKKFFTNDGAGVLSYEE